MKTKLDAKALLLSAIGITALVVTLTMRIDVGRADAPVSNERAHSAAVFKQMATVFQFPRCMNCHTATEFPRQADDRHRHIMSVMRGPEDHGVASLQCQACHRAVNSPDTGVPGAPDWHLAPLSMAWEGLSVAELCRSIFDAKHGGLGPDQLVPHLETDLVQWAWSPGIDLSGNNRRPPPVSREEFLALAREWIATGAACPAD
jgi:hypothetical protein